MYILLAIPRQNNYIKKNHFSSYDRLININRGFENTFMGFAFKLKTTEAESCKKDKNHILVVGLKNELLNK